MKQTNYSFIRGWSQIRQGDIKECRRMLMEALGVTSRPSFIARLRGRVEPKISEYVAIESIFHKFGVTNIWGEE